MIDNTEPTIDKIIDELLAEAIEKAITEWAGQEYPNDATFYDVTVKEAKQAIKALIATQIQEARIVTGDTSDGYHTFNELYEYRMVYNSALFNEWARQGVYDVHKSYRHSDGELCFGGGWFVVVAELPTGQVTNHYENKHWLEFDIPEKVTANKYDGHTPKEALDRIAQLRSTK